MKAALIIGLGGFLGSISRYLVGVAIGRFVFVTFPVATFTINILGSLALGIVISLAEYHKIMTQEWRMLLAVGFCGSFTTFSTFAYEGLTMLQNKDYVVLAGYLAGSIIIGIGAVMAGYALMNKVL